MFFFDDEYDWVASYNVAIGLLEEDSGQADNGATIKAKQFYRSCMNTSEQHHSLHW